MSKKRKKKHRAAKTLLLLAVVAGAGGAAWYYKGQDLLPQTDQTESAYKEETVRYGQVASGITESGSVTLGTQEQDFSVAEVVEISTDSSSSSDSGSSQSQMSGQMGGGDAGSMGGTSSGASGTSTTASTTLEVEEVYVKVGQEVTEGDPILKITDESIESYRSELESSVKSAELLVQQEEINVESKKAEADYTYQMYLAEGESAEETYQATITSLENAVSDLEEELADAEDEVEEYQYYVDCGYSYDDELEAAQLEYSTIEANLQIAKNNLTTQSIEAKQTYDNAMTNYKYADQLYAIDTDGLEDDLNDAQDTLDEANDALEEFESQIGDGIIYAEYTGTIQSVSYSAGDDITSDAAVATFSDADAVTITVSVAQDDISSITIGDEVSIELTAYDGESFDGEVTSIETASSMGSSTVNYNVEVRFTGDTSKVYSGMTGEVVFVEKKVEDTLYVSNKAVFQDGANSCVKVKRDDGTIETVTVKTGFSNGSVVAIEDGLEEGDIVLIESRVTS